MQRFLPIARWIVAATVFLLLINLSLYSQSQPGETISISSTVLDENRQPLEGVSIFTGDKVIGLTNKTGSFGVAAGRNARLSFTTVGYDPYTLTAPSGNTSLTIVMKRSENALQDMAVFSGTAITATTKPVDVIFIASGGSLYTPGPPARGYRIANTDFYDIKNPITLEDQPCYRSGSNTLSFTYNTADPGYFNMLGGLYDPYLGKWIKARIQNNVLLTKTSAIDKIEGEGATQLK